MHSMIRQSLMEQHNYTQAYEEVNEALKLNSRHVGIICQAALVFTAVYFSVRNNYSIILLLSLLLTYN